MSLIISSLTLDNDPNLVDGYTDSGSGLVIQLSLSTLDGSDTVRGISDNTIDSLKGIGIDNQGQLLTGFGNDTISGYGIGPAVTSISNDANRGTGIRNRANGMAIIDTGSGNDSVSGIGYGRSGFPGEGILNQGVIALGAGNDTLYGAAYTGTGSPFGDGTGINQLPFNSTGSIFGGAGNDSITGIGQYHDSLVPNGIAAGIGIQGGLISGGTGDDTITGIGDIGMTDCTLQGGAGNDVFKAIARVSSRTSIEGGGGNDLIDIGFNEHTIKGGSGYDTLILPANLFGGTYYRYESIIVNTSVNTVMTVFGIEQIIYL